MEIRRHRVIQSLLLLILLLSFLGVTFLSMVYMAKDNNYDSTIFHYFSISKEMYSCLMYMGIKKDTLINGMNLCSLLFIICNYTLSQFSFPRKGTNLHRTIRVILIVFWVLQLLLYSTAFQSFLYFGHAGFLPDAATYRSAYRIFHRFTVILNILTLAYSLTCLLAATRRREPIRTLRTIKWLVFILDVCICVLYSYMFFSLPDSFLWMSRAVNYTAYSSLDMAPYFSFMRVIPFTVVALILVLWLNFQWYTKDIQKMKDDDFVFSSIVASSEISTRALSHYIKNELLGIQSEAEMMLQEGAGSPARLENIRQSCIKVYERLDFLQRSSNRLVLNQSRCNIVEIVEQTLALYKESFAQHSVTLSYATDSSEINVFCDRQSIQEVFKNLINNALEAMAPMPNDQARKLDVQIHLFESEVQIRFQDSGPGISPAIADKLFQPFSSTKPTKYNWGIGLSFAKRIVKSHNGQIEAENAPGGARFTLSFPAIK